MWREACWAIEEMLASSFQAGGDEMKYNGSPPLPCISDLSCHPEAITPKAEEDCVREFHRGLFSCDGAATKYLQVLEGRNMGISWVYACVCACGLWSSCCHSATLPLICACQFCLGAKHVNTLKAVKCRWLCWNTDLKPSRGRGQMFSRGQEGQGKDNRNHALWHTGTTGRCQCRGLRSVFSNNTSALWSVVSGKSSLTGHRQHSNLIHSFPYYSIKYFIKCIYLWYANRLRSKVP